MINHKAARARLAEILEDGLPQEFAGEPVAVQRAGIDAVAVFPTVIVSQPSWRWREDLTYQLGQSTFPIATVISRGSGVSDTQLIDQLEGLWPLVIETLRSATETDPTLGGICQESSITRAEFGNFQIQDTRYPAQLSFIDLYG